MPQFTVFSSTGQSTDNLWPVAGPAGVAQVLTSDIGTYWIQLTNGAYVRYTGLFGSYGVSGGFLTPSSGSYSQIDITDVNGVVLASLTDLFGALASDIFSSPAQTVLGSGATFIGSTGSDTLIGQSGPDQFIVHAGQLVAGDSINGGSGGYGDDTLVLAGDSSATSTVITNVAAISSIESLLFQNGANNAETITLALNWNEVDAWANTLSITGRGDSGSVDTITVDWFRNLTADATLDLSHWVFSGWGAEDRIVINGSYGAESVTGSERGDIFVGLGGADTFNGGGGDDVFVWSGIGTVAGASFDGATGSDTIRIDNSNLVDFRTFSCNSVERLEFTVAGVMVAFAASQFGTSLSSNLSVMAQNGGGGDSIGFFMDTSTTLNLSGITVSNWESFYDAFQILGDADAETITGTNYSDVVWGGGGLDVINTGQGDDIIALDAGATFLQPSIGSIDGGEGVDTLSLNFTGGNRFLYFRNLPVAKFQSIEKLQFILAGPETSPDVRFSFDHVGGGLSSALQIYAGAYLNISLQFYATNSALNVNLSGFQFTGWDSGDNIFIGGNSGNNTIVGSSQVDVIDSNGGVDSISGGAGNDTIRYDSALPAPVTGSVDGGGGADILQTNFYTAGSIDLRGLAISGMETLQIYGVGGTQATTIVNASQFDGVLTTVTSSGSDATLQIEVGLLTDLDLTALQFTDWGSADRIIINGDADSELLVGTTFNDIIMGGGGDDSFLGTLGADTLNGGDNGNYGDTLVYVNSGAGVTVNLGANTASGGYASGDIISNFEHLTGSNFNDILTGNSGDNVLYGLSGADTIDGGGGYDWLLGGDGDDTIIFDAANNLALVLGGNDFDTLRVVNQAAPLTFNLATHQFERANVITDDNTGQWWSNTSDYYNASWQRTNSDIRADDGRLVQTTFDVSPGGTGQGWQFITDYRNASSVLTNQDGKFDNGTLFSKSFDYAAGTGTDGISDELREFTYFFRNDAEKAANIVANVEGFYDDGRKFTQTNDVDVNQLWLFQTNWYKTDGVTLDYQETRWDDGHTTIVPY